MDEPKVQRISDGLTRFETALNGEPVAWQMGVVDTIRKVEEYDAKVKEEGKLVWETLDYVAELVTEAGGPLLSTDQADEFLDMLYVHYREVKKKRAAATDSTPKSPSFTASIPGAGPRKTSFAGTKTFPGSPPNAPYDSSSLPTPD